MSATVTLALHKGPERTRIVAKLPLPVKVKGLPRVVSALEAMHGKGLTMRTNKEYLVIERPR